MPYQSAISSYQRGIVVGASSGVVAYTIQNYTSYSNCFNTRKIVGIFSDTRGERYLDTIYDKEWYNKIDTGF